MLLASAHHMQYVLLVYIRCGVQDSRACRRWKVLFGSSLRHQYSISTGRFLLAVVNSLHCVFVFFLHTHDTFVSDRSLIKTNVRD